MKGQEESVFSNGSKEAQNLIQLMIKQPFVLKNHHNCQAAESYAPRFSIVACEIALVCLARSPIFINFQAKKITFWVQDLSQNFCCAHDHSRFFSGQNMTALRACKANKKDIRKCFGSSLLVLEIFKTDNLGYGKVLSMKNVWIF